MVNFIRVATPEVLLTPNLAFLNRFVATACITRGTEYRFTVFYDASALCVVGVVCASVVAQEAVEDFVETGGGSWFLFLKHLNWLGLPHITLALMRVSVFDYKIQLYQDGTCNLRSKYQEYELKNIPPQHNP